MIKSDVVCPKKNLSELTRLRDAARSKMDNGCLIRKHMPVGPKPTLKSMICECFVDYANSNFGTTMGQIIYEYARSPTDREKLVWILEGQITHELYFDCASTRSSAIPSLSIRISWGEYQNSKTYPQRNYMVTVHSDRYGTRQGMIFFDDMLPCGRAGKILMDLHQTVPGFRIGSIYTERMRELYAKY